MWIIRQQEKLKRDSPSNDPCAHPLNTASLGPFQDRDMISPSLKSTSGIFLLHNNLRIDHVNFREYIHTHRKRKPSHDVRRVHQQRGETSPRAKNQEPRAESREPTHEAGTMSESGSDDWNVYRTRFLVHAKQLTEPLVFTDPLGREHQGRPGDYLVHSSNGLPRIAPREIFEDVYVMMETEIDREEP